MAIREENLIFCEGCKTETAHRYLIDTFDGIDGTYMGGSERYACSRCGGSIHYPDKLTNPKYTHLVFRLEPGPVDREF